MLPNANQQSQPRKQQKIRSLAKGRSPSIAKAASPTPKRVSKNVAPNKPNGDATLRRNP